MPATGRIRAFGRPEQVMMIGQYIGRLSQIAGKGVCCIRKEEKKGAAVLKKPNRLPKAWAFWNTAIPHFAALPLRAESIRRA